jgi:hypothetical protein
MFPFHAIYLAVAVVDVVALAVILHRLGHSAKVSALPVVVAVVLTFAVGWLGARTTGLPMFGFGVENAFLPAATLTTVLFLVAIALSPRLRNFVGARG